MYNIKLDRSFFPAQHDLALRDQTVGDILREAALAAPDTIGLVEALADGSTGRQWTFAAMFEDAAAIARYLGQKFEQGERVALWAPNSPEWVLVEFAAALAGLTLVTVNPSFQPKELDYVLHQSRSVALFLVPGHRGNPMAEIAATVCDTIPAIREMMLLDDLMDGARSVDGDLALPTVAPDSAAQIQYTSGTTGFPKGALLHHHGLINNARHMFDRLGGAARTFATVLPMFHTSGCALAVLGGVQSHSRNIVVPAFDPAVVNRLIEEQGIDEFFGVPTMLVAMLEAYAIEPRDFSRLALVGSGGSMVPPELIRQVTKTWDCNFSVVYGQTETSPLIAMTWPDDTPADIATTIGQPAAHVAVTIRDTATQAVVPTGVQGEICCRGYLNMLGYNDNPEATAATIDEDGWLHTGDLGTMDPRGYLCITGRVKEMIIRGGENLFPAEIENALLTHGDVAEIAVVGLPDEKWGEIVGGFIRLRAGATANAEDLKAHCRAQISAQKTPAVWVFVTEFPLTGSGKIRRFHLRDQWLAGDFN